MTRTLTVFATSDLHAHWCHRADAGIARVAAHIAAGSGARTMWIDNGDTLSGSSLGAYLAARAEDHPVLPFLEEAGLDVGVPGNHDFDHGADRLVRRVAGLRRAAYLCANIRRADDTPLFPASVILERGGIRVGVIGVVTGHLQRLSRYEAVAGIRVLDPVASAVAEAERLRQAVDVLLLSYHGGFEADPVSGLFTQYDTGEDQAYRLLREVPGLHGLIAGHQHRLSAGVAAGATGRVAFVQPGYAGERVGVLRFTVQNGEVVDRSAELTPPSHGAVPAAALASDDQAARRWFEQPSGLRVDDVHRIVAERTGVARTALLLPPEPLRWDRLAAALPPPYGVERYRMPRAELLAAVHRLPPGTSTRGLRADELPEHVDLVAATSLRRFLPSGRVQQARPYDWLDELASAGPLP